MIRSLSRCFLIFCALYFPLAVLAATLPETARHQKSSADLQKLAGTWVISEQSYDLFLRVGLTYAKYPTLQITPDGHFSLYLLGENCQNAFFTSVARDIETLHHLRECTRRNPESAAVGLPRTAALFVSEGTIEAVRQDRSEFFSFGRGAFIDKQIAFYQKRKDDPNALPYQFYRMFIDHPVVIKQSENGLSLEIVRVIAKDAIDLRMSFKFFKYPNDVLVDAVRTRDLLTVSLGRYFRCLLDVYSGSRVGSQNSLREDIQSLRRLLKEVDVPESLRDDIARKQAEYRFSQQVGDQDATENLDTDLQLLYAEETKGLRELFPELEKLQAYEAAKNGRFGAYLECPYSDRR